MASRPFAFVTFSFRFQIHHFCKNKTSQNKIIILANAISANTFPIPVSRAQLWFIELHAFLSAYFGNEIKPRQMMQIEKNTQNCKSFTSTRLIRWWKFPFSAIAKAWKSPSLHASGEGLKGESPPCNFLYFSRSRELPNMFVFLNTADMNSREPTSNKETFVVAPEILRLIENSTEDMSKIAIKGATFQGLASSSGWALVKWQVQSNALESDWSPQVLWITKQLWRTVTDYLLSLPSKALRTRTTWAIWRKNSSSSSTNTRRIKSPIGTAWSVVTATKAEEWSWGTLHKNFLPNLQI